MPRSHTLAGSPAIGDAQAAALVRAGRTAAFQHIADRHRSAVTSYLRTCVAPRDTADSLVDLTFQHAYEATRHGPAPDPSASRRLQLLASARGLALTAWSRDQQNAAPYRTRSGLSAFTPGFHAWATTGSTWPIPCRSRLLESFKALRPQQQTVLWHTVIEREGRAATMQLLGFGREKFGSCVAQARQALRHNYLDLHRRAALTAGADECLAHATLLASATAPSPPPTALPYLTGHLDRCAPCREAYEDLTDLDQQLPLQIPHMVLGWWPGHTYAVFKSAPSTPPVTPAFLRRAMRQDTARRHALRKKQLYRVGSQLAAFGLVGSIGSALLIGAGRDDSGQRPDSGAPPRTPGYGEQDSQPDQDPAGAATSTAPPTKRTPAPASTPGAPAPTAPAPAPQPLHRTVPLTAYVRPEVVPATQTVPAAAFTAENGTGPAGATGRTFGDGGALRIDNVDFGKGPVSRLTIDAKLLGPGQARLTVTLDDPTAAPLAVAVLGAGQPPLPALPLTAHVSGVHTVHISAACATGDTCAELTSLTFH